MISIYITHKLEKENSPVIFFFCDQTATDRATATAVLRGLIWQLTHRTPRLAEYLQQFLDPKIGTSRNISTLESPETLWSIWTRLLQEYSSPEPIYCLLDGLDECDDNSRRWLVKKLTSLQRSSVLRLTVVSRPMGAFENFAQIRLDPDNDEEIGGDILQFVSTGLQELSERIPRFEEIKENVKSDLLERADGTFLWIGFAMKELLKCKNTTGILKRVKELPRGLNLLYSHMLLRIEEEHRLSTIAILRWVTMAERSVYITEIPAILGLSEEKTVARERAIEDKVRVCQPFIHMWKNDHDMYQLNLVHMSARNYLLREHVDSHPVLEGFRINGEEAHRELAEFCVDQILEDGNLCAYAKASWQHHTRKASTRAESMFERRRDVFGEPWERQVAFWLKIRAPDWTTGEDKPPALYLACHFSFPIWAHKILAENWWKFDPRKLYIQTHHGETALYTAGRSMLWTVVDSLLAQGADIDSRDEEGVTLLMRSASLNDTKSLDLLLVRGASIEAQDHQGRTALRRAIDSSAHRTVGLLLDRGAKADFRASDLSAALREAIKKGGFDLVRILLYRGCVVDPTNTVFHTALELGDAGLVRRLLELRMGNFAGNQAEMNLHCAVKGGNPEIVRLLLGQGATMNPNAQSRKSVLHSASEWRRLSVLRLLIARGADANAKDETIGTAFHYLVHNCYQWMMQDLTESGTPAGRLSRLKNLTNEVVSLLLMCGADLDARDGRGQTAIEIARQHNRSWLVDIFKEHANLPKLQRSQSLSNIPESIPATAERLTGFRSFSRDGPASGGSSTPGHSECLSSSTTEQSDDANGKGNFPKPRRSKSLSDMSSFISKSSE